MTGTIPIVTPTLRDLTFVARIDQSAPEHLGNVVAGDQLLMVVWALEVVGAGLQRKHGRYLELLQC